MPSKSAFSSMRRPARGVTLVELMIAMAVGLALIAITLAVFLASRTSSTRQTQMADIQQSVRTAFDYLATDARMIGHMGCFTGTEGTNLSVAGMAADTLGTNYGLGVEGYDFESDGDELDLGSDNPDNVTEAAGWRTNTAAAGINSLPLDLVGGGSGVTPGSDVLVMRSVSGRPVRLTAATVVNATTFTLENATGSPTCPDSSTSASGLCPGSHGLIASCTHAQFFSVSTVASSTITAGMGLSAAYPITSEVFPAHTAVYYVGRNLAGTGPALFRRIFDGNGATPEAAAAGREEELIDGVENMQVRYGVDTTTPAADGIVDSYLRADEVADWGRVVTVRMSLLLRSESAVDPSLALPAEAVMNGVTVAFPTTGTRFDRRVFTTTVAIRNRIAYF